MRQHEHMEEVRSEIRSQISDYSSGADSGIIGRRRTLSFTLNKQSIATNARIYLRDIFAGMQLTSSAHSMGSFRLQYTINHIDCVKCVADVSFDASDSLRFGSLTRVPGTNKSALQFAALAGLGSGMPLGSGLPARPMTSHQFEAYNDVLSMNTSDFDEPFGPNAPLNNINLSWSWTETVLETPVAND